MTVNSVSFGKIILVNAPLHSAEKIAVMANKRGKTDLNKQVKNIINDTIYGKAHAFPANNSKEKSYIFSGKEGRKYWKSYNEAIDRMDFARNYFRDKKIADIDIEFSWRRHGEYVEELANSSKNIPVMNVKYNKLGDIKSVNLLA